MSYIIANTLCKKKSKGRDEDDNRKEVEFGFLLLLQQSLWTSLSFDKKKKRKKKKPREGRSLSFAICGPFHLFFSLSLSLFYLFLVTSLETKHIGSSSFSRVLCESEKESMSV